MRIVAPVQKNPTGEAKMAKRKKINKLKNARQFFTIYEHNNSNQKPFLSITSPHRFQKSKKFGHWTLGSSGKKTLKRSEQRKNSLKNFFWRRFYTLCEQKFSNLRPLPSITFPQGFLKSKQFAHWTSGSGDKIPLN